MGFVVLLGKKYIFTFSWNSDVNSSVFSALLNQTNERNELILNSIKVDVFKIWTSEVLSAQVQIFPLTAT